MSGGWIHSFAVTDTQTHKNGYTIYKIASIVFPRAIPQALTCITVWKRFHDIKRLHRELSRRQKSLKIPGNMPEPTDSTYFKRFDACVIERRKDFIIRFLDFVAQHSALYKCQVFFQFFNDNLLSDESPLQQLHVEKSGKVLSYLDEDEVMKINILTNVSEDNIENTEDGETSLEKDEAIEDIVESLNDKLEEKDKKPIKDYTRFLTPMASIESEDSDYIYEAALEFSRAVQAEANLEYSEAHMRYKRGVELLLNGSKDDRSEERKMIAKTKITKYLARTDDIFEKFLCVGSNNEDQRSNFTKDKLTVQLSIDGVDNDDVLSSYYIERPLNYLAKYKVLKILGQSVMQVYCVIDRQRTSYVIKGIEKPSSNAPTQTIFLPQHVPYMVDLLSFFQSDQKIYLLLRCAEAGRLIDYVRNYKLKAEKHENLESIFSEVDNTKFKEEIQHVVDIPSETTDHDELVRSSQRLLEAVTSSLSEPEKQSQVTSPISVDDSNKYTHLNKLPEASIKQWARELLVAIECLHEKGIILVDLHIENLLLGDKGQLLLTYFYQNQTLKDDSYSLYAHSQHYIAPERPFSFKSDWWSYGVILYELLLGVSFKSMHPGIIDIYGFVQYPDVEISESGRDILDNLLKQLSEERFDAEQIRNHNFFKGTIWDDVLRNGVNNNAKILH